MAKKIAKRKSKTDKRSVKPRKDRFERAGAALWGEVEPPASDDGEATLEQRTQAQERFDIPVRDAGALARLFAADLSSEEGRRAYLVGLSRSDWRPPTLDQLRLALRFARVLESAIWTGDDSAVWEAVEDGLRRMRDGTVSMRRSLAVSIIESTWSRYERDMIDHCSRHDRERYMVPKWKRALENMQRTLADAADLRFAALSLTAVAEAMCRDNVRPIGIAARLSMQCGAFGDEKKPSESDDTAHRRLRRSFEKAVKKSRLRHAR